MRSNATTPDEYVASLPDGRREAVAAIRDTVNENLPRGFKEIMAYGMINWVVPHELYPPGYHCDPNLPLGLMGVASQKNYISFYSMCLYGSASEMDWFKKQWPKHSDKKLDMGKSCIRFKKGEDVPLKLIGELAARITPEKWIEIYERAMKR
jgi:Domain of unknown function (DU1801)